MNISTDVSSAIVNSIQGWRVPSATASFSILKLNAKNWAKFWDANIRLSQIKLHTIFSGPISASTKHAKNIRVSHKGVPPIMGRLGHYFPSGAIFWPIPILFFIFLSRKFFGIKDGLMFICTHSGAIVASVFSVPCCFLLGWHSAIEAIEFDGGHKQILSHHQWTGKLR